MDRNERLAMEMVRLAVEMVGAMALSLSSEWLSWCYPPLFRLYAPFFSRRVSSLVARRDEWGLGGSQFERGVEFGEGRPITGDLVSCLLYTSPSPRD